MLDRAFSLLDAEDTALKLEVALALGDSEDDVDSAATTASGALASAFALAQATEPTLILLDDAHRLLPPQPGIRGSGTAEAAADGSAAAAAARRPERRG
mgnify:CR=1 FL=1